MCYYIGIEDLAANALIEIADRRDKFVNPKVSFKTLNNYGVVVLRTLSTSGQEAVLLLSRDSTNEFIHNYTEYFTIKNDNNKDSYIELKEDISTDILREKFRANISLNVLLAFLNKKSLQVLGV